MTSSRQLVTSAFEKLGDAFDQQIAKLTERMEIVEPMVLASLAQDAPASPNLSHIAASGAFKAPMDGGEADGHEGAVEGCMQTSDAPWLPEGKFAL